MYTKKPKETFDPLEVSGNGTQQMSVLTLAQAVAVSIERRAPEGEIWKNRAHEVVREKSRSAERKWRSWSCTTSIKSTLLI